MDIKVDIKMDMRTPDHPEWIPGTLSKYSQTHLTLAHAIPPSPNSSTPGRNKTIKSILPLLPALQMLPTTHKCLDQLSTMPCRSPAPSSLPELCACL